MYMDGIVAAARGTGFTEAVALTDLTLECDERLRALCNPKDCLNHGQNWVCPPGCGSLESCVEKAAGFRKGVLLQSVTDITPTDDMQIYKTLNRAHNERLRALCESGGVAGRPYLALTSGGCILCAQCAYPEPCVEPERRVHSLSAFGIDVGKLCAKAALVYSFRPDKVYFTALLLVR